MKRFYITLTLLVLAALLAVACAETDQGDVLVLPGGLEVIGEEAFFGAPFERAALPEGLIEIGPRAFAQSGLVAIDLPGSLTCIGEDAFADCPLESVTAPEGTYAYDWAVANGYIIPPLAAAIACDVESAMTGDTAVWTVEASGGVAPYAYSFELYMGDALVESVDYGEEAEFATTLLRTGDYHAVAFVTDAEGNETSAESPTLTVMSGPLTLSELSTQIGQLLTGETRSWTAVAIGGDECYQYRFELTSGESVVYARNWSGDDAFFYTFFDAGDYTLTAWAQDGLDTVCEPVAQTFSVTAADTAITARIRIYVDCDAGGNILRTNNKTGHYDLQLINTASDTGFSFDNYAYESPVFSFGPGTNSVGLISTFEGSYVPRANVQLYTLDFATTAAQVKTLMYDKLRDTYLDTENEIVREMGVSYTVTTGAFTAYNIKKTNCFTATAYFCNWLGYGKLLEIYNSSSQYTDYIAWKLFDKYGSKWQYQGKY